MIRRPPRSTQSRSSAASDVYKRQHVLVAGDEAGALVAVERHLAALLGGDDFLLDVIAERVADCFLLGLGDECLAVRPVPGRNLMAPPELARDAPRLDVLHPFEICLLYT